PGLPQDLRAADVQYLGVTSSGPVAGSLLSTRLYFGISTYAPWSTPNEVRFKLYIDSNRDGIDDLLLVNTSAGEVTSPATNTLPNDALIQGVYPLNPDGTILPGGVFLPWSTYAAPISSTFNLAPFNSSAILEWVSLKDLALPLKDLDGQSGLGP